MLCRALKLEHDRGITDLRLEFERDARELQSLYEDRMVRTREELARAREEEIRGIEKRKSKHIAALVASHEKAFGDIKAYYNEITHSNLDLIKTLKDEVSRACAALCPLDDLSRRCSLSGHRSLVSPAII